MNKTININLGGIFFHIDEQAYTALRTYLDRISRSLSEDSQGKEEIINDIEMRISEILSERIKDSRQVVSLNDIEDIIEIMGKPEDYEIESDYTADTPQYSGRRTSNRKLYRDADDSFMGGVCSGLGHYFGIEAIWLRLLFLVLFFGLGTGLVLYFILWILLPQANTTAEKLEMEGSRVDINNIEKRVRQEYNDLEQRVRDGDYVNKTKNGFQSFLDSLGKLLVGLLRFFTKIFGVIFIITGAFGILGIIIAGFTAGGIGILDIGQDSIIYPYFFYDSVLPFWVLIAAFAILAAVPFILFFTLGMGILTNRNPVGKVTGFTLLGLWLAALFMVSFAGAEYANLHKVKRQFSTEYELSLEPNDTLNLTMRNNLKLIGYDDLLYREENKLVEIDGMEQVYSDNINLNIVKSESDRAYYTITKEAFGKNSNTARRNARQLEFGHQSDRNTLEINGYFLGELKNYNDELEIDVTIYLPDSSTIYLDRKTTKFLNRTDNNQGLSSRELVDHHFQMNSGDLNCLDCDLN